MKDRNIPHIWRLENLPAGSSVWPYLIGHLVSYGKSHYHSFPDYFCPHVITKGQGTVRTLESSIDVGKGDMFTLWPGVEIEYFDRKEDPWEFYYFHIEGPAMEEFVKSCGFHRDMVVHRAQMPEQVADVFSSMYEVIRTQKTNDEFRILSLLYSLPMYCTCETNKEHQDKNKRILAEALTLISTQLATGINVNELCSKLEISRITLFRIFQKELRLAPIEYITRKRIDKAKELLHNTNSTMKTITRLAGFQSEKYFIRRFKKSTGMTPGEYRKSS